MVGFRDRRPEGGELELACARHTDPWIQIYEACIYCDGPTRPGSADIDGLFAHKRCHAAVVEDRFVEGKVLPRRGSRRRGRLSPRRR